ncbi:uncharacterized protein LOC122867739 isoform X2 [Siniperca chuatsi]|uniref:uncharacterized protein LOC122867739 isoform X2 n=1 Tax=Siniperca chuatsi TaxID=119488 RepID=UPI001CE0E0B0|nr:uncharacterized protein LOC122867739 isoform X2 [Siniperca chuatsi]
MSGVRRMQELKYFRDGATLVISLDGLNWLSKRRRSDKGIKKRRDPPRSCTLGPAHLCQAAIPATCRMSHWKTVAWSGKTTSQPWTAIFSVSDTRYLSATTFPCQHRAALLCPGQSVSFCLKPSCSSPMSPSQTLSPEIREDSQPWPNGKTD